MLPRRRRRHGLLPPARRLVDLRHRGADGPALVAALHAGRRAGQLRLAGQRPAGGDALHRVQARAHRHGDAARHRQGHRRSRPQLRRALPGAPGPALALPQPAGQRGGGHRGRHGHQHPAAQPAGGGQRHRLVPAEPRGRRRGAPRSADRPGQGARLPHRRADRRPPRHRRRVPHRPRLDHHAGDRRGRGGRQGPPVPGRHRASLPGQPGQPRADHRRGGQGRPDHRHRRCPRRAPRAWASAW